ncbi:transposase [Deinococcus sp. 14RED07]|uniref:transposase n=1 Tax=unclassified Deinococcus TaxID=2623546 RepID=UPI001E444CAD|nr:MULTISPECIES: transposase [unclassified Deinococcus]MCD0164674.1 transposase [Deinococcus sp. 12RED42]MCD0174596.1 transposase [Deinococcus sp. 14RED07]
MKTRQFTEAQIIQLLQDAQKGEKSVEELCRDFGCSPASFYAWRKKYGDTTPDEAKRLRHLEKENARLLRIVGQQRPPLEGMKEVLAKKR